MNNKGPIAIALLILILTVILGGIVWTVGNERHALMGNVGPRSCESLYRDGKSRALGTMEDILKADFLDNVGRFCYMAGVVDAPR